MTSVQDFIVGVVIDNDHHTLDKLFYYYVPDIYANLVDIGFRVKVPFGIGNKPTVGFVFEKLLTIEQNVNKLKFIIEPMDDLPYLLPKFIPLIYWMKHEFHCTLLDAISCFVPKFSSKSKFDSVSDAENEQNTKFIIPVLSADQLEALNKIIEMSGSIGNFLLKGVTGSGKTEIYIRLAQFVLTLEKQSIILVPEISLTPQTVESFQGRFGNLVAVFHSRLTQKERRQQWYNVRMGMAKIVVGARSAIFAPTEKLGLIVIDEAHEDTYKSEMKPRYHAINVALKRSEAEGAILVLGSATPRIEDSYMADLQSYMRVSLNERIEQRPLPPITVVDMRKEIVLGNRTMFSKKLYQNLEKTLESKEQAIILLNRRGYAQFVLCRSCGHIINCSNCNVSMTYHIDEDKLKCHYCAKSSPNPKTCPKCSSKYIKHFGVGTQKVNEELSRLFPSARILRMDMDTTKGRDAHSRMLKSFRNFEYDFLLGTQMIAKGLDFPNVTTVGVISADTFLGLPDFRNGEKTFQLLTQVAGRTGRGEKGGEVIVQTYQPEHYAIIFASGHDYDGFYKEEIAIRKSLLYPPFSHFARIILSGTDKNVVSNNSTLIADKIRRELKINNDLRSSILDLSVSPAPIEKINNRFRWQIIFKIKADESSLKNCHNVIELCCVDYSQLDIRISVDFYPVSLL